MFPLSSRSMGKTIIIFTNEYGVGMATALKEQILAKLSDSAVLIMDEMELRSRAIGDFAEKVFNVKMNFAKNREEIAEKIYSRFADNVSRSSDGFRPNVTAYRAMYRITEKFKPDLIITIGYGAVDEAVGTRGFTYAGYKIISLVDDYVLNKRLINPYVDAYIACTENIKNVLIAYGIQGSKIYLADIPVERKYLSARKSEISDRVHLDNGNPTALYIADGGEEEIRGTIEALGEARGINTLVYAGENREAFTLSVERKLYTFNEGTSLPLLMANADALIVTPQAYLTEVGLRLGKTVFLLNTIDAVCKRNATYLRPYTVDAESKEKLAHALKNYVEHGFALKKKPPVSDTDAGSLAIQIAGFNN